MNKTKKFVMLSIVSAFFLAVGIFCVLYFTQSDSEEDFAKLKSDDPSIGSWYVEAPKNQAEQGELTFTKDAVVKGSLSGYDFEGTYKVKKDKTYYIYNNKGKKIYAFIVEDDILKLETTTASTNIKWTLKRKE